MNISKNRRQVKKLLYELENISFALEKCQSNAFMLKQNIERERKNNVNAYFNDNRIYTPAYLKNYANYVIWCKSYGVQPLKLVTFDKEINKILSKFELPEEEQAILKDANNFETQFCGFISKHIADNVSLEKIADKAVEFALTMFPKAEENSLQDIAKYAIAYVNFYRTKSQFFSTICKEQSKKAEVVLWKV